MALTPYVALYRKYRPRSFAELVGQEAVARTLAAAITQGRLAHAYLFCGPRGTGKTSVARILAKSVNCETGPTDMPCGTCGNCREVSNGTNLDVIEIDAASNNGVDNIRDLQDRVALAPVGGRYKVYIIDEVHMLSQGAFNALLKTLEEPPPNVLFVLATTDPHKVLPTIISRCQRFDFGRIPIGPLVDRLVFVADAERIGIDRVGLTAIARRANGGLRDALSLLDQTAAMAAGQALTAEQVAASLGLLSGEQVAAMGAALIDGDAVTALEVAHQLVGAGHEHATILRELMAHFRHLLVLQLAPDRAAALDVPPIQIEALQAQAKRIEAAELTWVLEALNATATTIGRSPQQGIWLDLGLIKLARRPAIPSVLELAERVASLEARLQGGAAPEPQAATRAVPAARPAPLSPSPPPAVAPRPPQAAPAARQPVEPPPDLDDFDAIPFPTEPPPDDDFVARDDEPVRPPAPRPAAPEPVAPARAMDLPPRPPLAQPAAKPVESVPAVAPPLAMPVGEPGALRPVPVGAWDRLRDYVRARSMPTAALLDQQAIVDRWESDGAVVIRIAKAYKDIFDRQASKKKVLSEGVIEVFGKGSFPRLEVGSLKGERATATPAAAAQRPTPPAPPPPPAATPMAARPVTLSVVPPVVRDAPPDTDEPPAWLDDYESSTPKAAPAPVPGHGGEGLGGDSAVKLAVELFNGRVIRRPEGPQSGGAPA